MTYRELVRKLALFGCSFDRQGRGSHELWRNRVNGARTTIPNWGRKDLRPGTVRRILRDLGIDKAEFDRA